MIDRDSGGRFLKGEHYSPVTQFKKGHASDKKGLSFEEIYGKEKAKKLKGKLSELYKGKHLSPSTEFKKGHHASPKTEFKKGRISPDKGKKCPEGCTCHKHIFSKERGDKISETRKRLYREGKLKPTMLGRHHTKKAKEKISELHRGKENPSWKGGLSFLPYSPEFNIQLKDFIRQRDGYICQFPGCGIPENGRKHSVHHIDYNKKNSIPENLISLCHPHNSKVNENREYWTNYFQKMLEGLIPKMERSLVY